MPIYRYTCESCPREEEHIEKFDASPTRPCKCGGILSRKMGSTSFRLRGRGWYRDGYSKAIPGSKTT